MKRILWHFPRSLNISSQIRSWDGPTDIHHEIYELWEKPESHKAKKSKKVTLKKHSVSSKGEVIRASFFKILGTCKFSELDHLELFAKINIFRQLFRRATRDCATAKIYKLEYLWELKRNTRLSAVHYGCFTLVLTIMNKICSVLAEIISKTLLFWPVFVDFPGKSSFVCFCPFVLKLHASERSYNRFLRKTMDTRTDERTNRRWVQ